MHTWEKVGKCFKGIRNEKATKTESTYLFEADKGVFKPKGGLRD
jgi:hypothetical protein